MLEDPLMKEQLSTNLITVRNSSGSMEREFPTEVIQVTDTIHGLGMDPGNMSKVSIIKAAFDILIKKAKPDLPKDVKINPPKQMEKPIAEIIQDRIASIKNKLDALNKQTTELTTELTNCHRALAAVQEQEIEPPRVRARSTPRLTATQRTKEAQEFTEFVFKLLSERPMSVQDIAKARGIKAKHCYSRLFRLKEKGLLDISNNIVSKFSPGSP